VSASRSPALSARAARDVRVRPSPADLAYCRWALPRVSRTFAINIRLLSGPVGDAVRVAYLLCRIADTLEDAWTGPRAEVQRRFDLLLAALSGDGDAAEALGAAAARSAPGARPVAAGPAAVAMPRRGRSAGADAEHRSLVANTARVWRCYTGLHPTDRGLVAEGVSVLARGMSRYATRAAEPEAASRGAGDDPGFRAQAARPRPWIADEAELREYCWIVAGCVGVMLTGLVARRSPSTPAVEARRLTLAPSVGEGLQLTNILLDWPHDVRRGRCYLPATWLAEEGLTPDELVGAPRPGISRLAERLEHRALEALDAVPEYVASWPASQFRYRQFCLWPSLWALASLDHARRDPEFPWAEHRPRMPRATLWRSALAAVALGHGDSGVLALFRDFRPRSKAAGREPRTHP